MEGFLIFLIISGFIFIAIWQINKGKEEEEKSQNMVQDTIDKFNIWLKEIKCSDCPKHIITAGGRFAFIYGDTAIHIWNEFYKTKKSTDIYLTESTREIKSINYSELLKCEVIVQKKDKGGTLGDVIVGGALFGGIGATAAFFGSNEVMTKCIIRFYTKDIENPIYDVNIYNPACSCYAGSEKEATINELLKSAEKIHSAVNLRIMDTTNDFQNSNCQK